MMNKIRIGRTIYKIKYVDYLDEEDGTMGKIRFNNTTKNKNLILIDKNLSERNKQLVLFHEIIHGIFYDLSKRNNRRKQIDFGFKQFYQHLNKDEDLIDDIAKASLNVFKVKGI